MTRILLVCHEGIGEALLDVVGVILDRSPDVEINPVRYADHPDRSFERLAAKVEALRTRQELLILTDLPGATPHNLAQKAADLNDVPLVSGVNVPMLLCAINHSGDAAAELADRAVHGGRRAIVRDRDEQRR